MEGGVKGGMGTGRVLVSDSPFMCMPNRYLHLGLAEFKMYYQKYT